MKNKKKNENFPLATNYNDGDNSSSSSIHFLGNQTKEEGKMFYTTHSSHDTARYNAH